VRAVRGTNIGIEPIRDSQGAQVLDQYVETQEHRLPAFDKSFLHRRGQAAASISSSECVGRKKILAHLSRLMPLRPARAKNALDALRAAHLDDGLHVAEIDAKVETGRTHHRLQLPLVQGLLHPVAQLHIYRPVMKRQRTGEVGCDINSD